MSALASCPGAGEMENTLGMCLNGEVRSLDAPYLIYACMTNRHRGPMAWEFVKSNWDEMLEAYPDNSIVRMVGGIRSLSKPDQTADVMKFFETHSVPTGELTLEQYFERLEVNVAFRQRETGPLTGWLLVED